MDVNVGLLERLRGDAEFSRARLDQRQRGLRAFLHHVAQLAGQDELAGAGHARGFDEQDIAAHRRPREAGGDAGDAAAHRDLGLELARAEDRGEIVGADRHLLRAAFGDAHRDIAEHVADLALEIAHARLARVVVDDRSNASSLISHCSAASPVAASWRGTR